MSALFEEGFFVRKPAWHGLGVVLADFPGRDEAYRLAGHDYTVEEFSNGDVLEPVTVEFARDNPQLPVVRVNGRWFLFGPRSNSKGLRISQVRDGAPGPLDGNELPVQAATYTLVQNDVPWQILDLLLETDVNGKKLNYETGATLDEGAECFVTAWLDEPIKIGGDDSEIYPYVFANWRHDGGGAVNIGSTNVRIVCANTVAAAKAQAERSGTIFQFKHTKNVHDRIEDAKLAIRGIGAQNAELEEFANELAEIKLSDAQVEEWVVRFTTPVELLTKSLTSEKVQANIAKAQEQVRTILSSATIPEAHKNTGWGLYNAGVEHLDHVRKFQTQESYVRRTLLTRNKLKDNYLVPLIREVAAEV